MSINKRRAAEDLNPVFYFFLISGSIVKDCLTREGITHLPLLYRRLEHQNQSVNINWLLACRDRRALFNFTIDFIDKAYSPASAGTHKRQFGRIYNVLPPFITVIVFEGSSALFKAPCLLLFVAFSPVLCLLHLEYPRAVAWRNAFDPSPSSRDSRILHLRLRSASLSPPHLSPTSV